MKVVIEKHYSDAYTAVDDNTYDGPGSPIGFGSTPQAAEQDLREKMEEENG